MGNSRLFAYNSGPTIPGTSQSGTLAVSNDSAGGGAVTWWNGPNEDIGYVIGYPDTNITRTTLGVPVGARAVGFRRTFGKSDALFLQLANNLTGQNFQTASVAKEWLNTNGYYTSYSQLFVTADLVLRLDASDISSYSGTGSTWNDLVSPQQNITLVNSPTHTSGVPSYFTFNGSNQRGSGTNSVLTSTTYTKSVWFYLNSYADNNLISSDVSGHYMYFQGTNKMYAGHTNWAGFPNNFPSTATFSLNTWYNATITFNTTDGMKLYINGLLDSSYVAIKTAFTGDGRVNIASYGAGNLLNGRIAKVYCYSRSLNASEVLQNFDADKAHFGL